MAVTDTVQVPGEPPVGRDGISSEFLRQQLLFDQQVLAALQALETQINVGRKTV
jgi:hypothetical protein